MNTMNFIVCCNFNYSDLLLCECDLFYALVAFSALTLLVGRLEGHPAFKKIWGGWWRWALVSPDGVASQMVGVSASVNLPLH